MEILGDDEAGLPTPPPRRSPFTDELALDGPPDPVRRNGSRPASAASEDRTADGHAADDDPDDEADPAPVGRARLWFDTVVGAESLGIAGLFTAVTGVVTTGISPFVLVLRPDGFNGVPAGQTTQAYFAPFVFGFGAVALLLGVAAVLRVRPASPAWVRGVAGATVLVAALMLAAAGWAVWNAPTAPVDQSTL